MRSFMALLRNKDMEDAPNSADVWMLRHKVAELENNLADSTQQHGQETSDLRSQLAKQLTQLEQSEAQRLDIEYQLVVSRQEAVRLREALEERDSELQSSKAASQGLISKLSKQCQEWQHILEAVQQAWSIERDKNHELLSTKEQQMASFCLDHEELKRSAAKLTSDLIQQQNLVTVKEARIIELEEMVQKLREVTAARSQETETTIEREAVLKTNLNHALDQLRSLEAQLEVERSAAQDFKSSSEASQRSLKETQEDLRSERTSRQLAEEALKQATHRASDLKQLLDTQAQKLQISVDKLQNTREELLKAEHVHVLKMREKDSTIEEVSRQLELCKASLDALRQEVSEATQRQSQVVECYGSFVQQLREEAYLFCMNTLKQSGPYPTTPTPTPAEVVKALGTILKEFQKQHEANLLQIKALKAKKSRLTQEYTKCQENLKSNTLAKEELEARLHQNTRDLSRARSELTRANSQVCEQKSCVERLQVSLDRRGELLKRTREEHAVLKRQDGCRQQTYFKFLDALHVALQGAKATPPAASHSPPSWEPDDHNWSRLSSDVLSMARCVGEELKTTREELVQLRTLLEREKSEGLVARAANKEIEAKFSRQLEDQENIWRQKLARVSSEYAPALDKLSKKMERQEHATSDALEHAQALLGDNQSLLECLEQSQADHRGCAARHFCLLAAVTLLSGSLSPALCRVHTLSSQRQLLSNQLVGLHTLRVRLAHLTASMQAELGPSPATGDQKSCGRRCGCHSLLKFRKAAIVVLAMNRLVVLGRETLILFAVAREGGFNGSVVVHPPSGGVRVGTGRSKAEYLQWLQSEDVGAKVYESLGGLQGLLSALPFTSRLPQLDSPTLVVKSALCGLLQGLLSQFECDNVAMEMAGSPPLCRLLGRGLTSVLARRKNHYCCIDGYVTCLELAENINTCITGLTDQLRGSAAKLHDVQRRLQHRDKECETFAQVYKNVAKMEENVEHLKQDMVPREEYEVVCRERSDAVKSRETLETSMASISKDLQQAQMRCESLSEALRSRDLALTDAAKSLSDVRVSLKHKDQQTKHLEGQLNQYESEKQLRARQLEEMMEAMQKLTSEKELTYQVMLSAETAFRKSRQRLGEVMGDSTHDFGKQILQAIGSFSEEKIVTNPGAINRCEHVLKVFVEAHQCALSCMSMLNEQLTTSKGHIEALKAELNAVCLRQCDDIAHQDLFHKSGNPM